MKTSTRQMPSSAKLPIAIGTVQCPVASVAAASLQHPAPAANARLSAMPSSATEPRQARQRTQCLPCALLECSVFLLDSLWRQADPCKTGHLLPAANNCAAQGMSCSAELPPASWVTAALGTAPVLPYRVLSEETPALLVDAVGKLARLKSETVDSRDACRNFAACWGVRHLHTFHIYLVPVLPGYN